jgi:hypothetical protein
MKLPSIGSEVTSIVSSYKYCAYSSIEGRVLVAYYEGGKSQVLNEGNGKHRICDLKISIRKHFLYGLLDKSPGELMIVWNVMTGIKVHEHDLDIEDRPEDKEDAYKLMIHLTYDASLMFIRGCFRKGVSIISFDDGVLVD